jgi:hypothetical protein
MEKTTPPDIVDIALEVAEVFEALGILYQVGGSLASSAFGVARSTMDVDIVADVKAEHARKIEGMLRDEFYVDEDMIKSAVRRRGSFNLVHMGSSLKIDVFIPKNSQFDRQAFGRRILRPVSRDDSRRLYFSTPEDIIIRKLEWYRKGGGVSERQLKDVQGVLKVQGRTLDMEYIKRCAEDLELLDLLEKALADAGL